MMSTGFAWNSTQLEPSPVPNYKEAVGFGNRKRRFDDDAPKPQKLGPRTVATPSSRYKRTKTPRITGQNLPIPRLIEVLDRKSLQSLLDNLVQTHPEVAETIQKLSPKPSAKDSLALVKEKFTCITHHLPYKCDVESDYLYVRVKLYLHEFLDCVSDFILNVLPPIETNISNSIQFLDSITSMIHQLPNFSNSEFQYTKNMAYNQIANTWLIVLSQRYQDDEENLESTVELIKVIEDLNLQHRLQHHNQRSSDKFKVVSDFVAAEVANYDKITQSMSSQPLLLSDLITVDYSNYSLSARTSH